MSDDLSITKKIAIAFQPKYTLSEQQLMKYKTNVGAYDYEAEEVDTALQYSREKLSNVLANRGVVENSVVKPLEQGLTSTTQQQPVEAQEAQQQQPRSWKNRLTYKKGRTWSNWYKGTNSQTTPTTSTTPQQPVEAQEAQQQPKSWKNPSTWFKGGRTRKIKKYKNKNKTKKR